MHDLPIRAAFGVGPHSRTPTRLQRWRESLPILYGGVTLSSQGRFTCCDSAIFQPSKVQQFIEMGINVVQNEEVTPHEEKDREEEDKEEPEGDNELVEVLQNKVPAKAATKEPTERSDDPVRMYLREMGTVELLSREGEIAIAKRIEAGREAMIAGLCESPLTFQAIIIWRDELNEGKIFLRDIIDLEATYAGPDAKNNMNPLLAAPLGPDGQPLVAANANGGAMPAAPAPSHIAPPAAPPSPPPFRPAQAAPAAAAEGESTSEATSDSDL